MLSLASLVTAAAPGSREAKGPGWLAYLERRIPASSGFRCAGLVDRNARLFSPLLLNKQPR